MKRMHQGIALATTLVLLAGCSTPYQKYSYSAAGDIPTSNWVKMSSR